MDNKRREMIRRLRLGDLRKLLRDRCGPTLPDDDAGHEYLYELLLPVSVGPNAEIKMPNAIEVWAPWMSKQEAAQLIDQIKLTPIHQRKPNAKVLGQRLNLSYAQRQKLGIRTIAACDVTDAGMKLIRKRKRRERERLRRRLNGARSRAEYLAASLTKTKPWNLEGISRAKWYRREISPCPIKPTIAERLPVSPSKPRVSKEGVAEQSQSALTALSTSQAQNPEMQMTDTPSSYGHGLVSIRKN
jgi:hypothetical protein